MVARIGVEIAARRIHDHLAQQARFGELVQRVVDGGERNLQARISHFVVQAFRRHMPVAVFEQQAGQLDPLAGGTQAGMAQPQRGGGRRILAGITQSLAHRAGSSWVAQPVRWPPTLLN